MNGSRQLRSLGLLLRAVGCAAIASASTIGCMAPADSPEPAGEAEVGRKDAREDDRGGALPQARSGTLALGGQLAFGIAQVFDENNNLIGYSYNEPISGGTLQRWVLAVGAPWDELVIKPYHADHDLVAIIPAIVEQDLSGWAQIVATQWEAFPINPTYVICASNIYEHGGMYDGVSWESIPPLFPEAKLPAFTATAGWQLFAPQDLIGVTPTPPPSTGRPWPPGPGDLAAAFRAIGQTLPGDGKIWQHLNNPVLEYEPGWYFSKGGVFDGENAEYFYMNPDYTPAGSAVTTTTLETDDPEMSLESASEFAEAVNLVWTEGSAIAINGCLNTKNMPTNTY